MILQCRYPTAIPPAIASRTTGGVRSWLRAPHCLTWLHLLPLPCAAEKVSHRLSGRSHHFLHNLGVFGEPGTAASRSGGRPHAFFSLPCCRSLACSLPRSTVADRRASRHVRVRMQVRTPAPKPRIALRARRLAARAREARWIGTEPAACQLYCSCRLLV